MDPLSIGAAIAGFTSLVIQLTQLSVAYAGGVSEATKGQTAYIQELLALRTVLEKYKDAADTKDLKDVIGEWDTPFSATAIDSYKRQLEKVKVKLDKNLTRDGLLSGLKPFAWPFQEAEMARVVELLHRIRGILHSSLSADHLFLSMETFRKVQIMHNDQQLASILSWLTPSVPQTSVDSVLESYCEGTCQSIFEDERYLDWRDGIEQLLWVSGQPGSGKTMLSANLIQNLTEISGGEVIISYHFFRTDNIKDSVDNLFRDLLQKALPQTSQLPPLAIQYHKKFSRSVRTPTEKLWEILLATKTPENSIYIILDGLDEFQSVNKLFPYINRLAEAGMKVLVASRDLPTIYSHLYGNSNTISATKIEIHAVEEDIRVYVEERMRNDCVVDYDDIPLDIRNDLLAGIIQAADGSFLLSRFAMDFICTLTSVGSLRTCLATLPSTYEKAYEVTFERVIRQPDSIVNLAKRVLNWVLQAKRPLTMLELQHAIVIDISSKSIASEALESPKLIITSCLGLISLSKADDRVFIVHATARQFLLTNEQELSEAPQLEVARSCLRYLAFDEFSSGACESVVSLRSRLTRMPFLNYCAHACGNHVRQFQKVLWEDLKAVLCSPPLCASVWQVVHYQDLGDPEACEVVFSAQPKDPNLLHVAAFWGFSAFIGRCSWKRELDLKEFSPVDYHGWTPLHWAASMGYKETSRTILMKGVNINALDVNGWTPLTFAIVKGHFDVVKYFLSRGADRKTPSGLNMPPEDWSSVCTHENILQLLRDTPEPEPLEPPSTDEDGIKRFRHQREQRLEEEKGWKVSIHSLETSMDPLELEDALERCERRWEEVGMPEYFHEPLVIQRDTPPPRLWGTLVKVDNYHWRSDQAKVGLSTSLRKQMLELAILQEKLSVVKLVVQNDGRLAKEIPRGIVGKYKRTFLHTATYGKNASIVNFLIQMGGDGGVRDGRERTPLHLAAAYGSLEIVQAMLNAPNVDVDARDKLGRTPIQWCCAMGGWKYAQNRSEENIQICNLLLSKGSSLSMIDNNGHSALHYAIILRDKDVIKLFLDSGLQLSQKNKAGESPLDIITNKSYHSEEPEFGDFWDRPYADYKYLWRPSNKQTMAALRVVAPYIGSEIEMTLQVKELLRQATEVPPPHSTQETG